MTTDYSNPELPLPDFPGFPLDGAAGEPSVHTEETSEHFSSPHSYRTFLTSGNAREMAFHRNLYRNFQISDPEAHLKLYDSCRTNAWFMRHKNSGLIRVASSRCGLRWCPLCIKSRRYVITQAVAAWLKNIPQPKFMTLTLKHSESPLSDQIDALYKFFKELKRRKIWKKRVFGGVWFFQVKKSKTDGLYHPHIHVLIQGRYIPHDELSLEWQRITHVSKIVDIRPVKNVKKAVEYVARYAAAPCKLSDLDDCTALDVMFALHSRRICGSFGLAKCVKLSPTRPDDFEDWQKIGSFSEIMSSKGLNGYFNDIVSAWKSESPWAMPDFWIPPPKFIESTVETVEILTFKQAVLF